MPAKEIAIGSDHAGFELKSALIKHLESHGYLVKDYGTNGSESVDYPDFAHPVANAVDNGECEMAVLICGSANGVAMTANKHQHVRAAICWRLDITELARQHNDANIICLPARFISSEEAIEMLDVFLNTPFEGGRHARRVGKIGPDLCSE
jgi:ribose 5-phosphate isomerase B